MLKICTKCGIEKDIDDFYLRPSAKDGHCNDCKICNKLKSNKYNQTHKVEIGARKAQHYQTHQEEKKEYGIQYYQGHKVEIAEYQTQYRQGHGEEIAENDAQYYQNHKDEKAEYQNNKYKTDIQHKLKVNLRGRIRLALKGIAKSRSTMELLGCAIEHLKNHLESLFQPGMAWDNYGFYGWHIDHRKACSWFDLTDPEQQKQCFHYTNLQPLWAKDNIRKGARITLQYIDEQRS